MTARDDEFRQVHAALEAAGLPSQDFGRFVSGAEFDFRRSVPVLLELLPSLTDPDVVEAAVRSLSTRYARPAAAEPLLELFRSLPADEAGLKWAVGNALDVVTTAQHRDQLLDLALDRTHGTGRQMIVYRLGRLPHDEPTDEALRELAADGDVALHAMIGLRRRLGPDAVPVIEVLKDHQDSRVRKAADIQLRKARRSRSGGHRKDN